VNDALHFMHAHQRRGQVPSLVLLFVCLLVGIRLAAGFVCFTCFADFEKPKTRNFYLHSGGDADPCHHGQPPVNPLTNWACTVTQDDPAFILPEVPRLPVIVSLFAPLFPLAVSYEGRPLIAAHGRGPPFFFS
jgi:hypothetical protein